jgi:hypothetical protein
MRAWYVLKKIKNILILFIYLRSDYFNFVKKNKRFIVSLKNLKPLYHDKTKATPFDPHYLYHSAWAARIIKKCNPEIHTDISSSLSFGTIISAFVPVKFYDYRPANIYLNNFVSEKADLCKLSFADNSVLSLSCLHTIEHIGLGRYGDPIDPDGDLKAINELVRVLAPDGNLLLAIPIGKPKVIFNAHRIYSYDQIMDYLKNLHLEEFSLIPDDAYEKGIIHNASKIQADCQNYGCGCFWFKKL